MIVRERSIALFVLLLVGSAFVIATIPILFSQDASDRITLVTTTSTDNSGLLNYIHPEMTKDTGGITVDVVAVGTGAALEQARRGLADVVIVHNRELEDRFISEGFGIHRIDLMYNDFILVGPRTDPAGIRGMMNSSEIFRRIYAARGNLKFFSRGDNSGTHLKELELWDAANISIISATSSWASKNPWYSESGAGMGETLTFTSISQAYTLTDRGTWLFMRETLSNLVILASGPLEWHNPYGVILVNPAMFQPSYIKFEAAKKFVQWLISEKGQHLINNYTISGEIAFNADFPNHVGELSTSEREFWGINETQNNSIR